VLKDLIILTLDLRCIISILSPFLICFFNVKDKAKLQKLQEGARTFLLPITFVLFKGTTTQRIAHSELQCLGLA
jgi:Cu/Ag efflux protein CusF